MQIMLLDPSEVFRVGLRTLISRQRDDTIFADDSAEADEAKIAAARPDLVVADLNLPGTNGIVLARHLRDIAPAIRVVITGPSAARTVVEQVSAAGARGYVVKTQPGSEIVAAITKVAEGGEVFPPDHDVGSVRGAGRFADKRRLSPDRSRLPRTIDCLSMREREIFDLVVLGWKNRQIAHRLQISIKTVETHRGHVNKKLGVHSSADFVRFASFSELLSRAAPSIGSASAARARQDGVLESGERNQAARR